MLPEQQIEELFDRCIDLEHIRYGLQDKIENILDFLLKSHITVEEMEKVQEIAYKKENN
jgi:hypothetical protein